jgi:hypothetical protein
VVNVQHACFDHSCGLEPSKVIRQEREVTVGRAMAVKHQFKQHPGLPAYILNTGQMRNAVSVQNFRTPSTRLNREQIILNAVVNEFDAKKGTKSKKALTGRKGKEVDRGKGSSVAVPSSSRSLNENAGLENMSAYQSMNFS